MLQLGHLLPDSTQLFLHQGCNLPLDATSVPRTRSRSLPSDLNSGESLSCGAVPPALAMRMIHIHGGLWRGFHPWLRVLTQRGFHPWNRRGLEFLSKATSVLWERRFCGQTKAAYSPWRFLDVFLGLLLLRRNGRNVSLALRLLLPPTAAAPRCRASTRATRCTNTHANNPATSTTNGTIILLLIRPHIAVTVPPAVHVVVPRTVHVVVPRTVHVVVPRTRVVGPRTAPPAVVLVPPILCFLRGWRHHNGQ